MNYEEMIKFAYEDIVDSFEKEAKKKKEEDREKIYDTPLGKRHVIKGALKGAAKVAPLMAISGAVPGATLRAGGIHTGYGKTWEEATRNAKRQEWIDTGKGAGIGGLVGAGIGATMGALAGAKGASDQRKLSQLSPERQKAIQKKLSEANNRYNAAVKKGYKNNEDEYVSATNDLNTALAEYNKALREGKQILKNKKSK